MCVSCEQGTESSLRSSWELYRNTCPGPNQEALVQSSLKSQTDLIMNLTAKSANLDPGSTPGT